MAPSCLFSIEVGGIPSCEKLSSALSRSRKQTATFVSPRVISWNTVLFAKSSKLPLHPTAVPASAKATQHMTFGGRFPESHKMTKGYTERILVHLVILDSGDGPDPDVFDVGSTWIGSGIKSRSRKATNIDGCG